MSKLADIGQAQNQPVSIEVMEVAEEEIARLRKQNENQAQTIRVLTETVGRLEGRIQEQAEAIGREECRTALLQGIANMLADTPQNTVICPVKPPVPTLAANVPGEAVGVHPAPNITIAGGG